MQALNAEKCFYDLRQLLTRQIKQSQKAARMRKKHRTAKDYITLQKTAKVFRAETHKC